MPYIDGFLLCVPKKNMKAYVSMARRAGKVWREHGALDYRECVGDDMKGMKGMAAFPKVARAKAGEAVVFSWIAYRSKAHRDAVNKKVMKDERMDAMIKDKKMPFDLRRMAYGGFRVVADNP
jgi:uncharacterized protein YbaA (DUF1428 family)